MAQSSKTALIPAPVELLAALVCSSLHCVYSNPPPHVASVDELVPDDRYRHPKEMGIFKIIQSPSEFKLGDILSRIQKKQVEFQNKIDRKKKTEREWFDNKYKNGDQDRNGTKK